MRIETLAPRRYPASFVQQRFWELERDTPGAPFYNHALCVRLRGVDAALVRQCVAAAFERHEILRTRLGRVSGEGLVQEALPPPAAIESSSLDNHYQHNNKDLVQYLSDQARRVLPLDGPPAVRAALFELPRAEFVFLLVSHPGLLDNASSRLLQLELLLSYGQLLSGGQIHVPRPYLQYGEFAYWQRKWFDDARRRPYAAFWSHYLRGASLSAFPDWPNPRGLFVPRKLSFHFGASAKRAVSAAAGDLRVGPASIFLTAYCAAIHREIVDAVVPVGVLIANRGRPEIQHTLGNFANSVVLLAGPGLHVPWPQRAREVHEEFMNVLPYSDLPLDVSIEKSARDRPAYSIQFSYEEGPEEQFPARFTAEPLDPDTGYSKFLLSLRVTSSRNGLQCALVHDTSAISDQTARSMVREVAIALEHITGRDCVLEENSVTR